MSIDTDKLLARLKADEGEVLHAYLDPLGVTTIGIGRNIDGNHGGGITHDEAMYLLQNDVERVLAQLLPFAWFSAQDDVRRAALVMMAFNLGIVGLLHFPHFLGFMAVKDYADAVSELIGTPWHAQVGARADRIVHMITTGAWP